MTGTTRDQSSILSVSHVAAIYNYSIVALHDVSLTVQRGEITALIGANGAGKTTTLKAVSNLLPANRGRTTSGYIIFDGHDVSRTSPTNLVRLGLVNVLEGVIVFKL